MDVDEIVVFSILNNKNITGEFIEDYKLLQSENERLRKKLHDILLVDTTDGMTASEWVDRTAKAESQLSQLRAATTDANVGFMIQNKALKKANDINAQLRQALEEFIDAWDGYEMLAALDADVYRKAQAVLEVAKGR